MGRCVTAGDSSIYASAVLSLLVVVFHGGPAGTNRYATIDLQMKRNAIERARPIGETNAGLASCRADASILKWLEAL